MTRLICFFWIIAKIISWKVWLANRLFPVVPPFNFLFVPSFIHTVLFILSLVTLFVLLLFPLKKKIQISVIVIELLSCLLDQNRWQPWEYQYIFIILALIINYKNEKNTVSVIAFTLIALYFFSGISKFNLVFSKHLQNQISTELFFSKSNSYLYNLFIYHAGYLAAFIETVLGIGLFFNRTKKAAAIFLIIMHLLLLIILGSLGINYNAIIWPWNIVMIFLLYIIFISNSTTSINLQILNKGWNRLFIAFLGILPFFNFFGYWDFYLSSSLYSYRTPDMYICIHKQGSSKVLKNFFSLNKNKFLCDSNSTLINILSWSVKEIDVPPYPEVRIYKSIKEQLIKRYPDMNASFIVFTYVNGKKVITELK